MPVISTWIECQICGHACYTLSQRQIRWMPDTWLVIQTASKWLIRQRGRGEDGGRDYSTIVPRSLVRLPLPGRQQVSLCPRGFYATHSLEFNSDRLQMRLQSRHVPRYDVQNASPFKMAARFPGNQQPLSLRGRAPLVEIATSWTTVSSFHRKLLFLSVKGSLRNSLPPLHPILNLSRFASQPFWQLLSAPKGA